MVEPSQVLVLAPMMRRTGTDAPTVVRYGIRQADPALMVPTAIGYLPGRWML